MLQLFVACQSQWSYAGMGSRVGIPYDCVKVRADAMGVDFSTPMLADKFDACVDEILKWEIERNKVEK